MAAQLKLLRAFLFLAAFAVGLFYEWLSAFAVLALLIYLVWRGGESVQNIAISLPLIAVILLVAMYAISVFWAVDQGAAVLGVLKYLPLPLFVLLISPLETTEREKLLDDISLCGVLMTVLSSLLRYFPIIGEYFTVNSRLAGFFQYPNSFALFLLLGLVILGEKTASHMQLFYSAILVFGIFQSGSRAVLVLMALLILIFCFTHSEKRGKIVWGGIFLMGGLILLGMVLFFGEASAVNRFFVSPFSSSTFLGRLLYWKDAVPVILTHPLGLGYSGYRYLQGSFQTGVYSLQYVHNDLLQILLDVGWLPALVFAVTILQALVSKKISANQKLVLCFLCAHSLFDFDLQFLSIWFVLLLTLDYSPVWKKSFTFQGKWTFAAAICFSFYFGITNLLFAFHLNNAAACLYPAYTAAWMEMLPQAKTAEEMDRLADQILRTNQSVSLAWSAKSKAAYAKGNFAKLMLYKEKAISLAKYETSEYLDYFNMLYTGMLLYEQAGDYESAAVCRRKMNDIPNMMQKVLDESDPLAWKIHEKPKLSLPEGYVQLLKQLK